MDRRKRAWRACQRCRQKKTKCDGEFPCKRCKNEGLVCTAGIIKKTEYKRIPMGYAEVLESTQLALIATVHKLYAMVRNGQQWDLAEPELNDRGQPIIHNIATLLGSIRSNADADLPPHTVFPEDEGGLAKLAAELELPQQDSNMVPIKLETDFACSRTERASSSELDHSDSGQDYRNTVMSSQNVQPDYPESFTSYNDFYTNTVPTEMDPSAMFPVQSNTNPAAVPSWKMARPTQWALLPNNFIL
ncbi:hypothetical protein BKA67DRAFT_526760 [Truncatella angustata]|uniref:Zn(2)-C6 fungal-type domain-containing protein n=1 Tax=Truncatella angustata TaxID=152316 RepID=A0A9P8U8Y5_9PEZI|nr:uncharacterized protein BKA67DRAFT_526760 [Truncatella angustata]KAH6645694.1 hypothetical protein BKA67DRAFT_526760 [Truncatella angustata]